MIRILLHVILCAAVLFFPWWVFAAAVLLFAAFVRAPYEIVLWGFLYDVLYGAGIGALGVFSFLFTVAALLILLAALYIKPALRVAASPISYSRL